MIRLLLSIIMIPLLSLVLKCGIYVPNSAFPLLNMLLLVCEVGELAINHADITIYFFGFPITTNMRVILCLLVAVIASAAAETMCECRATAGAVCCISRCYITIRVFASVLNSQVVGSVKL